MKVPAKQAVFTGYIITIALFNVCLFLYGFFPIKSSSDLFSSEEDFPTALFNVKFHKELLYKKSVGKTIIMVIDGIRVDFVKQMPYTSAVLQDSNAKSCLLTARVSAPTVTLPRVKAIVTGTVSSFIDVVLNFDTKELKIDNIVHQATKSDKKVVFYGDDTWVKLFPHQFYRSEGTSSFYVNDYSEVDDNVTRHLTSELEKSDWDLMILHYLGLDHIGHIEGPKSSLIQPKLQEMDDIIARLYNYLRKQGDGLLVVCGDHGMKDSGSHGGVSLPEVLVPVVALGVPCPNYDRGEVLQVDLAATLSALWAAPLPADSIGVAVPALLSHLTPSQRMYVSLYNAEQLVANFLRNRGTTSHESYKLYEEAKEAHYKWLTNDSSISHHQVEALYQTALLGMSRHLSSVMANYDMYALLSAMCLLLQIIIILGVQLRGVHHSFPSSRLPLTLGVTILASVILSKASSAYHLTTLPGVVIFCTSAAFVYHLVFIYQAVKTMLSTQKIGLNWSALHWLLLIGTVLFLVSLFSSSFVEEEHQLWYFLWVTLGVVCVYRQRRQRDLVAAWVTVMAAHRVLRALNQTGDQWAHLPDLSDWLIKPDNKAVLSTLFLISIILLLWCCFILSSSRTSRLICICSLVCIYLHKAGLQQVVAIPPLITSGTTEARLCLLLISLQLLVTRSVEGLVISWSLLMSLLLRPYNVILLPALYLCSHTVSRTLDTHTSTYVSAALHHWLGAVFFFYQGNSNSLASVDVAAGYVGLEEYNVGVVAVLLLSHTYSMPVLAFLLNIKHSRCLSQKMEQSCQMVVFLQMLHVLAAFTSVTIHRYHLFVWTVFSPKLLYVAAQTFVVFVLVIITNICLICFQRPKKY